MQYQPRAIEKKWQNDWKEKQIYRVSNDSDKPKYYVLDMFPYPSGSGLHVGHPLGYIASDIISRYKRLQGYNVLHPMGFDAFGLPAEQYAINHGIHPAESTANNIQRYKDQLENIGFSFDWSREVKTSDPSYYKWTQWIFLLLFDHYFDLPSQQPQSIESLRSEFTKNGNQLVHAFHGDSTSFSAEEWNEMSAGKQCETLMNYRLAYRKVTSVNWCEELGTVLANDEIKDGKSERGGYDVEQRPMLQWSLRITAYAERLLNDLDELEWSSALKAIQRNWIGKSEGARIWFSLDGFDEKLEIFTTRPDTLFGATFMVIAPEHPQVVALTTDEQSNDVKKYQIQAGNISARDRQRDSKTVSGVFTGGFAIHPITKKKIPVWISDYVLMDYGTGAIMAVPSDDERDFAFAQYFDLDIIEVIDRSNQPEATMQSKQGVMINSDFLNGMEVKEAISSILAFMAENKVGQAEIQYKLRDANYSRQRYWGEPFPVYFDNEDVCHSLPLNKLPLELPELNDFKPASGAKSPLARLPHWSELEDGATRETDTMPGFAGSSWYFLRYMDPHNNEAFASVEALDYWQDVDLYIGGTEHAVGHLLYSRFWHKFLFDLKLVPTSEPFKKLVNQGMIQGRSNFVYRANEQMAEHFFHKKLNEYHEDVQRNYPVAGIYVDFAMPEKKLAIEIKPAAKLVHLIADTYDRFQEEGWTLLGIPVEEVGKYWNNFDLIIKKIHRASEGKELEPIRLDLDTFPVFISKDMVHNQIHVTSLPVDIHLVKDDKLDVDRYAASIPELNNALFITNSSGEYICGHAIEKMSKSKYNVINPDEVVEQYGADVFRMYEMFLGPIEQSKPWDTQGIDGVSKFLHRFWSLFFNESSWSVSDKEATNEELKILHQTLKKIDDDIERFAFNTCVSQFMIITNALRKLNCNKSSILSPLVVALSPFAPHIAEELWHRLGNTISVTQATVKAADESYLVEDQITYPISVNGKKRTVAFFASDASKEELEKSALALDAVQKWIDGKEVRKVIVVPGRMINIVV